MLSVDQDLNASSSAAYLGSQVIKPTCDQSNLTNVLSASGNDAMATAMAAAAAAEQQRGYWNFAATHAYPTGSHIQYPSSQHFQFLFPSAQTVDWSMGYHQASGVQQPVPHLGHIPTHSPSASITTSSFANLHPLQQPQQVSTADPNPQNLATLTLTSPLAQPLQVGQACSYFTRQSFHRFEFK